MANKFAWASIGEDGKVKGGKVGDQTGKEVRVGDYYDFGQNMVIRFRNLSKGKRAATIAKMLAENDAVGYSQSLDKTGRASLYDLAASVDWSFSRLKTELHKKKVNCDCSSFCSTVINLAFAKKIIPCSTTSTIEGNCKKAKDLKKTCLFVFLTPKECQQNGWHKGDMANKAGKHIIINV